jgi:hypothetical protein
LRTVLTGKARSPAHSTRWNSSGSEQLRSPSSRTIYGYNDLLWAIRHIERTWNFGYLIAVSTSTPATIRSANRPDTRHRRQRISACQSDRRLPDAFRATDGGCVGMRWRGGRSRSPSARRP